MRPPPRGTRRDYAAMEAGGEVPEAEAGAAEQPRPKARRRTRKVRGPGAPEAAPSGAFAPAPAAESDSAADQDTMPAITADAVDLLLQMDGEFGGTSDILQPVLEVSALFESKRYILNPYEGDFMDDDYAYWSPQYGHEYTLKVRRYHTAKRARPPPEKHVSETDCLRQLWDGADTIAGKLSIELNHLVHDPLNSGRRIKLTQWRMESLGGSQKQLVILGVEVLGPAKTLSARAEEALSVVLVTAGLSDFQKLAGFAMASKSLHKVVSSDMTPWRLTAACMTAAGEPPPLPEGWTELSDDDGNKFYYHAGRNQTTTRRPMDYMFEMDYNPLGIRLTKTKANAILKLGAKDLKVSVHRQAHAGRGRGLTDALKPGTWVDNISFIEHT